MAYTIVKTDGTVLTTIADGTINTTSTSIGLPGRNYAGYGQQLDTNFVHTLENFAAASPPPNALRGQLWFNTNNNTLYVCPTDGESNAAAWLSLTSTASGGTTTFGQVTITGNVSSNNMVVTNNVSANAATFNFITIGANVNAGNITSANANVTGTLTAPNVSTGSTTTSGNLTGVWTVNGSAGGSGANAMIFNTGGIYISNSGGANLYGIKCDKYMYANGDPISFAGTYSNSNVALYLPTYGGAILTTTTTTTAITTGANTTPGTITGNWSLTAGSRLNATYADLAERFAADEEYDAGTVVALGGEKEITAVQFELSEDVFGVISNTAAYLMNAGAGNDETHPAVAVSGRVQVKVTGTVKKGDRLVSAGNGIARAAKLNEATPFNTIGRALEAKITDGIGYVEAFVAIK
jgi:hypothetical protein